MWASWHCRQLGVNAKALKGKVASYVIARALARGTSMSTPKKMNVNDEPLPHHEGSYALPQTCDLSVFMIVAITHCNLTSLAMAHF